MKIIVFLVLLMLSFSTVFAQNIDERLQELGESYAKEYIKPLVTAFGTNLNSSLYNSAEVLSPSVIRPVRFGFSMHAMVAMVPSSDQYFEFQIEDDHVDFGTYKTATVFGDKGYRGDNDVTFPDGLDLSLIPLFVPQFRFGLPKGNELMIRYLPSLDMGDFGSLDFWGIGLKHSIDQYIPLFPVHLSVQGAYQSFSVGDLIDINTLALNAQVSKRLLMLTIYGGLGWEETELSANYQHIDDNGREQKIDFDIKGDNNLRMTAGFRWAIIPFVHINADYTISYYQAFSLGLGFQI